MPDFDKLFYNTRGKSIHYNGLNLYRIDDIEIPKKCSVIVRFISTKSKRRQGIKLSVDGNFTFQGHRLGKKLILWEDTATDDTLLEVVSKQGVLQACNAWDNGKGSTEAWQGGAAMIVEEIPNGRRYRCNDFDPDEDFDDLIFEVEILEADSPL